MYLLLTQLLLAPLALAATLTFRVQPTTFMPSPHALKHTTTATLFSLNTTLTTPITRANAFTFPAVPPGSYLLTVSARDVSFPPHRVDVTEKSRAAGEVHIGRDAVEEVGVWGTFWGNEWGNKGEERVSVVVARRGGVHEVVEVDIAPDGVKEYYVTKQGFSVLSLLKSPMILMAIVSLGMIVGVPYLVDSMDEETKAEFEEMQRQKAIPSPSSDAREAIQNFDLASWMAGRTSKSSAEKES